MICDFAVPL